MGDTQDSVDDSQQQQDKDKDSDSIDEEVITLRRAWLATLPHEQIIQIIFKLEQHIPEDVKEKIQIWPEDITTILEKLKSPQPSKLKAMAVVTTAPVVPPVIAQPTPYPHAPYYPPPIAATSTHLTPSPQPPPFHTPYSYYPHYPGFPPLAPGQQPPYAFYPQHPPPPPPPHSGSKPLFTSAPLVHPPVNERNADSKPGGSSGSGRPRKDMTNEDLPSYEEMIVEGLSTFSNEDGVAPKALFAWIATRYPVQANFRPSASQALQKAYKRGRLEKSSSGGKYRLNPNWEGGATRRGTRRPQTSSQATVHLPSPTPSYPWPQPQFSSFPIPDPSQQTSSTQPQTLFSTVETAVGNEVYSPKDVESEDGEVAVWEAAQNILQALDLSSLIDPKLTKGNGPVNTSTESVDVSPSHPSTIPTSSPNISNVQVGSGESDTFQASLDLPRTRDRDTLQRNLALLAVQLADLAGYTDSNADLISNVASGAQVLQT